mgnify:FL=1
MKKKILIICIFIIFIFAIFKIINIKQIIIRRIYPTKYEDYVYKYSEENNIDPYLTFAIIKAESNFNKDSRSKSNAKGLMQLMDATAEEIAKKLNMPEEINLFDAEINIRLGTNYIATLLKYYNNNLYLALSAYNAGIGNVNKWIENGTIQKDGSDIENIPFKETENYVRKIQRDYKIYTKYLGDKNGWIRGKNK